MEKRNPDRIDFNRLPSGVVTTKYWKMEGRDVALNGVEIKPIDFDLDGALAWCEEHGYTVIRWPTGARAFKGAPWPLRSTQRIRQKRDEVTALVRQGKLDPNFNWLGLDFAYAM
jgi:hypothetical protein